MFSFNSKEYLGDIQVTKCSSDYDSAVLNTFTSTIAVKAGLKDKFASFPLTFRDWSLVK